VEIAVHHPAYAWSFSAPGTGGELTWGPLSYDLVLIIAGIVGYIAAGIVFSKRDLPAPL